MKLMGSKRVPMVFQIIVTLLLLVLAIMAFIGNFCIEEAKVNGSYHYTLGKGSVNFAYFYGALARSNGFAAVIMVIVGIALGVGALAIWLNRPYVTAGSTLLLFILYLISSFGKYGRNSRDYWFRKAPMEGGGTTEVKLWISETFAPYYIGWVLVIMLMIFMVVLFVYMKNPSVFSAAAAKLGGGNAGADPRSQTPPQNPVQPVAAAPQAKAVPPVTSAPHAKTVPPVAPAPQTNPVPSTEPEPTPFQSISANAAPAEPPAPNPAVVRPATPASDAPASQSVRSASGLRSSFASPKSSENAASAVPKAPAASDNPRPKDGKSFFRPGASFEQSGDAEKHE